MSEHGDGTRDAERLRSLRLSEFLRDLVRQEGKMEAAEMLGVNYKTLVRAEKTGEITGRMGDALERLLGTADDPEVVRLRERGEAMEERMEGLEEGMKALRKELRDGLSGLRSPSVGRPRRRARSRDGEAVVEDGGEAQEEHEEGAGRSETRAPRRWPDCARRSRRRCVGWTLRS